jgi:hypothetical protein
MSRISILNPGAESGVAIESYGLSADVGRPRLRVALVSNGFPDSTNFLTLVGEALSRRLPDAQILMFARLDPTVLAAAEVVAEIARSCDVAVTALGHCGSCTSSAVRDAVNLARAGVPAAALISEKFWDAGVFNARSVGMPGVPRVRLPHPVAGTGQTRMAQIAKELCDDLLSAWSAAHARAA